MCPIAVQHLGTTSLADGSSLHAPYAAQGVNRHIVWFSHLYSTRDRHGSSATRQQPMPFAWQPEVRPARITMPADIAQAHGAWVLYVRGQCAATSTSWPHAPCAMARFSNNRGRYCVYQRTPQQLLCLSLIANGE